MNHTPKPWHVQASMDQYGGYIVEEAANEQEKAETDEEHRIAEEHDEGNRLLIEAAPDLYEASVELLREWDRGNLSMYIQKLSNAFHKAEGR